MYQVKQDEVQAGFYEYGHLGRAKEQSQLNTVAKTIINHIVYQASRDLNKGLVTASDNAFEEESTSLMFYSRSVLFFSQSPLKNTQELFRSNCVQFEDFISSLPKITDTCKETKIEQDVSAPAFYIVIIHFAFQVRKYHDLSQSYNVPYKTHAELKTTHALDTRQHTVAIENLQSEHIHFSSSTTSLCTEIIKNCSTFMKKMAKHS